MTRTVAGVQIPGSSAEPVTRTVFRLGGSVAVRLPKRLADAAGIEEGTTVVFRRQGSRIIVEVAGS